LKFLQHLRVQKPKSISIESAKSLAEYVPCSPSKLSTSDLPVWMVTEFFAQNCYKSEYENSKDWEDVAIRLISQCHVCMWILDV